MHGTWKQLQNRASCNVSATPDQVLKTLTPAPATEICHPGSQPFAVFMQQSKNCLRPANSGSMISVWMPVTNIIGAALQFQDRL